MLHHTREPQTPLCVWEDCGQNPHERLGLLYDKSSARLNGSDDFHAAIWIVVILAVNPLLDLTGVATVACVVRLKMEQGNPPHHLNTAEVCL